MGAGQSSGRSAGGNSNGRRSQPAAVGQEGLKTSYYTLLGVERTATPTELKKGYRKVALELHPDRNHGREEWATGKFAEVQAAYDVLSDPHERAWYDAHENAILRGDQAGQDDQEDGFGDGTSYEHNVETTSAAEVARMMGRFRPDVDFSDSPDGFYGFTAAIFERLAKEERLIGIQIGVDLPFDHMPSFGYKNSDWQSTVRPFYAVWAGFATIKSFSHKDKYRVSTAPDRYSRRQMEKENKKAREAAIREFNDAVRTLVGFVRKRDPRVRANVQTDEQRQKAQREAAAAQAARDRAQNEASLKDARLPDWLVGNDRGQSDRAREDGEEDEGDEGYDYDDEEEDEIVVEEIECVACNKTFKSDRQFEAHEKSKKHQKAVRELRRRLEKEEKMLGIDPVGNQDVPFSIVEDDDHDRLSDRLEELDLAEADVGEEEEEGEQMPAGGGSLQPQDGDKPETQSQDDDRPQPQDHDDDTDTDTNQAGTPKKKLGKAAQKRAKKAAKQQADKSTTGLPSPLPSASFVCAVCNAPFESRSQMFRHIEAVGHAIPVSSKKEKGRRKGKT